MALLGDEAQAEARFSTFVDNVLCRCMIGHGLSQMYHRLGNRYGCTRRNCKVTLVMWNLISVRLETVLLSVRLDIVEIMLQDRCMFCVECTIGFEIILDPPDGTPR
jgi:hypothetical protein